MKQTHQTEKTFLNLVEHTIASHRMIDPGNRLLIAVSGGPDSVALALSLLAVSEKIGFTMGIAHVNHQLRGTDARKDEAFVRRFAQTHRLPFHCTQIDVRALARKQKLSVEEAGREARYGFFQALCHRHDYARVATGHTKDDNAELVLMNLLRGSGPKGLAGIPPIRDSNYIRPLIRITKKEILQYLDNREQPYRQDASNTDPAFLRNRIRRDLIPHLEKDYNPAVMDTLDRLSQILSIENDYLSTQAEAAASRCMKQPDQKSVTIDLKKMTELHPAIRARVIRQAILKVKSDLKRIQLTHLNDILALCRYSGSGKHLDLPGRIRVYKSKNGLTFKKEDLPLREIGKQEKSRRRQDRGNRPAEQ